jgi:hypothetical protein
MKISRGVLVDDKAKFFACAGDAFSGRFRRFSEIAFPTIRPQIHKSPTCGLENLSRCALALTARFPSCWLRRFGAHAVY